MSWAFEPNSWRCGGVTADAPAQAVQPPALIGALGVALVAVGNSDVWRIAATLPPARLGLLCAIAVGGAVATLIVLHGLWERVGDRRLREMATSSSQVLSIHRRLVPSPPVRRFRVSGDDRGTGRLHRCRFGLVA